MSLALFDTVDVRIIAVVDSCLFSVTLMSGAEYSVALEHCKGVQFKGRNS